MRIFGTGAFIPILPRLIPAPVPSPRGRYFNATLLFAFASALRSAGRQRQAHICLCGEASAFCSWLEKGGSLSIDDIARPDGRQWTICRKHWPGARHRPTIVDDVNAGLAALAIAPTGAVCAPMICPPPSGACGRLPQGRPPGRWRRRTSANVTAHVRRGRRDADELPADC